MRQLLEYADILAQIPFCLGYAFALTKFCKKIWEISEKSERLFVLLFFGGWLLLNMAERWHPMPYILYAVLYNILFMGLVLLLFPAGWEKKILAASVLMAAERLVGNLFEPLLSCLVLLFKHVGKKIPVPFLNDWESGAISCICFALAALVVCGMPKYFVSVFHKKPGKWYAMLAIPLLVVIAVLDIAAWGASNGIMLRSRGGGLYYDQLFSHLQFCILAVLAMSAAVFYVLGMNRIYLEQEKSSQYHSQIAFYKMLAEEYMQSERLRHDMKNHIIALSALFREKEWEKMGSYLGNMEDIALQGGDMTGNTVVDALLYQKRKRAEQENIRWGCDVQMPKGCGINEFDLCVLFGNILDNALEACSRMHCGENRFISIQAKTVKKCLLIDVKNSMDMAGKDTDGFAGKGDLQEGIGLQNVGDVVEGYHGALNIEAGNGIFVISILIPFPDSAHDMKRAV